MAAERISPCTLGGIVVQLQRFTPAIAGLLGHSLKWWLQPTHASTHTFALWYINSGDFLATDNYGGLFDFDDSLSEWTESEYEDSDDDSGPDAVALYNSGESAPPLSPELAPVLEPFLLLHHLKRSEAI